MPVDFTKLKAQQDAVAARAASFKAEFDPFCDGFLTGLRELTMAASTMGLRDVEPLTVSRSEGDTQTCEFRIKDFALTLVIPKAAWPMEAQQSELTMFILFYPNTDAPEGDRPWAEIQCAQRPNSDPIAVFWMVQGEKPHLLFQEPLTAAGGRKMAETLISRMYEFSTVWTANRLRSKMTRSRAQTNRIGFK